jgi:glucose-6-phosphate 1-dehydrogenase
VIGSLLLLGASGDLSGRLLLPAFGQLLDREESRRGVALVGAGVEDLDNDAWQERVRTAFASGDVSDETLKRVLESTRYQRADVTSVTDLQQVSLPAGTTLVLEKPFGTDEESAASLNQLLAHLVPENQVHRVDHFLGRSTVLNLIGVRFANRLFEPVWSNEHIERIDVTFDEQLTLENRARYYDHAGALVDMIQSHLLQVLSLIAMEPIAAANATDLRDAKAQVLRACRPWNDDPVSAGRRARYTRGTIEDREVPDYTAEPGVDAARNTETLAELTVEIDNWRWSGVPFRLRSGKALRERRKEVLVTFKPLPHLPTGLHGQAIPDQLRLTMSPDRMALEMNVNGPNDPLELDRVSLDTDLTPGRLPAYGEVLAGVLDGDPLLAVRGDTAVECWRIVDPILQAWRDGKVPMDTYAAGSDGPANWS